MDRLRETLSNLIDALLQIEETVTDAPTRDLLSSLLAELEDALHSPDDVFQRSLPELHASLSRSRDVLVRTPERTSYQGIQLLERLMVEAGTLTQELHQSQALSVESATSYEGPSSHSPHGSARESSAEREAPHASALPEQHGSDPRAAFTPPRPGGGGGAPPFARTAPAASPQAPPVRVVNTGFSERTRPESAMNADHALNADGDYWYWVEIGQLLRASIEDTPTALPGFLAADAELSIAVFSFPGELILSDDADVGTVRLTGTIASVIVSQPGKLDSLFSDNSLRQRRMFFPVKTPATPGRYRMRCNIYYRHVLLQSRIITAYVGEAASGDRALRATVDYQISNSLDPARLARIAPQILSVFVNDSSPDSHGFYLEGDQFKTQSIPDGQQLQDSLTQTRKALRRAAWGSADPFQPSFSYRYASAGEPTFFASDLIALAIRGYMVYSALINTMSGGPDASDKLAALMLKPGRVQICSKESARMVVPAAIFYDYPLDTQLPSHRLCDAFLRAVRAGQTLADTPCFRGECPHLKEMDVVCPGGFWGYRHELGLPVSISESSIGDAETDIQFNDPASMVVIVSMDQMFTERQTHEARLKQMRTPLGVTLCQTRSTALTALEQQQAQLVYFYCHGGLSGDNTPFLSIGNNEALTPDNLRACHIRWKHPRPLVFMNGCMTTALEPEKAIDFVSAFVNQAGAAGVIGTEITVFEPLATAFAEAFLRCFIGECKSIGESIKLARLALLEQFNPLGLVYIPFALPGLHLVDLTSTEATGSVQPQAQA